MITDRVWTEIESPLFTAALGVVSTPRAFDDGLLRQAIFRTLLAAAETNGRDADAIVQRISRLIREPADERYCHPHDLPIGVYLRALDIAAPERAITPARLVLDLPNLWWGNLMARRVAAAPNRTIPSSRVAAAIEFEGIVWKANSRTDTPPLPSADVKVRVTPIRELKSSTASARALRTVHEGRFRIKSATTAR